VHRIDKDLRQNKLRKTTHFLATMPVHEAPRFTAPTHKTGSETNTSSATFLYNCKALVLPGASLVSQNFHGAVRRGKQHDMNKNSQIPIPQNDLSARRVSGSPHNNSTTPPRKLPPRPRLSPCFRRHSTCFRHTRNCGWRFMRHTYQLLPEISKAGPSARQKRKADPSARI
jgi:hypothetical protein